MPAFVVYGLLVALGVSTVVLSNLGVEQGRAVFVAAGFCIGLLAYRKGGLPLHAEAVIVLFVFGPLMRRLVDFRLGYDVQGVMLSAPLAATIVVFPQLRRLLHTSPREVRLLAPYTVAFACTAYAWSLTAFQGNFILSAVIAAKYVVPPLYCVCLLLRPDQSENVLRSAAKCFLILSPIIGLYGIWQHLDPQPWDVYWMAESKIPSIGKPLPGMVRVFSTMNAPVSFAAYATFGLLLFSFSRRTYIPFFLVPIVAVLPLCFAILLTEVRTAWISTSVSLMVCLWYRRTRKRALVMLACLGLGVLAALTLTSFGDSVSERLDTMTRNVANDGSGAERLSDYYHVFRDDDRYIFGVGFAPVDTDLKMMALDGQVLMSAYQMGTTIGIVFVMMIVWAALQALSTVSQQDDPLRLVAAALLIANLVILPLTSVAVGEVGFLFWMLIGVLYAPDAGIMRLPKAVMARW